MQLIYEDKRKRIIKEIEEIAFDSFSSFHLLVVSARTKSKKQISEASSDDEDLFLKIDKKTFPKLTDTRRLIDSPAAFSGGRLHNFPKSVYFLTFLKGRKHQIELKTDEESNTATFKSLKVYTLNLLEKKLTLDINQQAEDGNRRSWITFVLDNLALKSFTPTIAYSRRKRDSDDVKIIINGKTQENLLRKIKHFLWRYVGSLLPWSSPTKTETETFTVNFPQELHYLEFEADRMPTLQKIIFDFGTIPPIPEGIPTVDNPKWTKDFYDDTEETLLARAIYGEAGGELQEAKIGVGWAIRNRVEDRRIRWGKTYHEVILKPFQYEPFNDPNSDVFKKITNPSLDNPTENKAWRESFQVVKEVILGKTPDPTNGANHFYAITGQKPSWADEKKFTVEIGVTRFYKL